MKKLIAIELLFASLVGLAVYWGWINTSDTADIPLMRLCAGLTLLFAVAYGVLSFTTWHENRSSGTRSSSDS